MINKMKQITDHIGIILSCACVVHCFALPVLIATQLLTSESDLFHEMMIALTLVISGHALWHGWKKHCHHIVLFFGALGLVSMITALGTPPFAESVMTTIGGLFIISAHLFNMRLSKNCCKSHTNHI